MRQIYNNWNLSIRQPLLVHPSAADNAGKQRKQCGTCVFFLWFVKSLARTRARANFLQSTRSYAFADIGVHRRAGKFAFQQFVLV